MKANLNYLKKISKVSLPFDQVREALAQNKALTAATTKPTQEASSSRGDSGEGAFTEEDFKAFEKSYFGNK
jgi:hypothetical protein